MAPSVFAPPLMTTLSAALLLFLILDPLGNIPVFLSLLKPLPGARRRLVLARELLIALAVRRTRGRPLSGVGIGAVAMAVLSMIIAAGVWSLW